MVKKLKTVMLLLLTAVLLLAIPGKVYADNVSGYDEAELKQTAEYILSDAIAICSDESTYESVMNWRDAEMDAALISAGYPISAANYKSFLASWKAAQEECGVFMQNGDLTAVLDGFKLEKESTGVNLVGELGFAEREANVTFSFARDGTLKALTVGGKYTTGEILKKAGLNTLIGMGTVFGVLILISLLISTFKFIPAIRERFEKKNTVPAAETVSSTAASAAPAPAVVRVQPAEPLHIPDGATVSVQVRETKVSYVSVREIPASGSTQR